MFRIIRDNSINERLIRELFRALLHRDPEPEALNHYLQQLAGGYQLSDIAGQIVSSREFRLKLDDLPKIASPPEAAVHSGVSRGEPGTLQVVIVTTDGFAKVKDQAQLIASRIRPGDVVTVLDGSAAATGAAFSHERVEVFHFPNESVFHLRMRLPSIARNVHWLAVIEDHVIPDSNWVEKVYALIDCEHRSDTTFTLSVANLTSRSRWSWASFLLTFAPVWHPIQNLRRSIPYGANILFPRSALPAGDLAFCEFESTLLPKLCARATVTNAIPVDHVQHCSFRRAASLHFHSGRFAGAHMRTTDPARQAGLKKGIALVTRGRVGNCADLIAFHPLKGELPSFTLLRIRLLAAIITLGYFVGACSGYGKSPWKLE